MDFLNPIIKRNKEKYKHQSLVLSGIEHDLHHLGLSDEIIREDLIKARKILGEQNGEYTV